MPLVRYIKNDYSHPLSMLVDEDRFMLDAPYQRGAVWTIEQQRALIKSLIMELPIGSIITSFHEQCFDHPHRVVVDGQQRIRAIRDFVNCWYHVPADWFMPEHIVKSVDGQVCWAGLAETAQRKFKNLVAVSEFIVCRTYVGKNDDGLPQWVKHNCAETTRREAELYLLVNMGGTDHTEEDLARARAITEGPD